MAAFVIRTTDIPGIFDELQAGRARIGWSYEDRLDLRLIKDKIDQGEALDEHECAAKRCLGFLTRVAENDYLVYPHQPKRRQFTVVQVTGGYDYSGPEERLKNDFRSYRPCSLETPHPVSSYDRIVPSQLRHRMGTQARFSEIYDTRSLFLFLEAVPDAGRPQDDSNQPAISRIYSDLRELLPDSLHREFSSVDLSRRFCKDLFERMGYPVYVQEGPHEAGSDVVVTVSSQLLPEDVEFRVGVQVFSYKGNIEASALEDKLNQLLEGWDKNKLDYGLLLTTGNCGEDAKRVLREHYSNEPCKKVRLIEGDQLADFFLRYFPLDY